MKKRFLSLLLALILCLPMLNVAALAEGPDHLIVSYLTLGTTPPDLPKIVAKLNERTIPEINVEVEFKAVSAYDAMSLFPTWIATGGEQIDLMMPLLQDLQSYVDQDLILPLDDLIAENGPYLSSLIEEGIPIVSNNIFNGEAYAIIGVKTTIGANGGFVIGEKYVEEAGFDYDENRIYTLDDLTGLFAKIKELHPSMYPCGIITAGKSNSEYVYASGPIDSLSGAPMYTGVLMGTDSTTIVDLFESEPYQDYLRHLREWNLAGYIHPDAATMDGSVDSLKLSGVSAGYFMVGTPVMRGEGDVIIKLSEQYLPSEGAGGWVIPFRSKCPEAAIRFLDLVWRDQEIMNLIQWGIEGDHYVMLNKDTGYIGFPEGISAANSAYYNSLGLWGDGKLIYSMSQYSNLEENMAYTEAAAKNPTQGIGIRFIMDRVSNEVATLSTVVAQYVPALECGSVDLETYYPQFIQALKAAGIDRVIAEKQRQFDEQYSK